MEHVFLSRYWKDLRTTGSLKIGGMRRVAVFSALKVVRTTERCKFVGQVHASFPTQKGVPDFCEVQESWAVGSTLKVVRTSGSFQFCGAPALGESFFFW